MGDGASRNPTASSLIRVSWTILRSRISCEKTGKRGFPLIDGRRIDLDQVSHVRKGGSIAVVIDTVPCPQAVHLAKDADILLCESTYLEDHRDLAEKYMHMTAKQAALIAKEAHVKKLILTHFSARYQDESAFEKEAREVFPIVLRQGFRGLNFQKTDQLPASKGERRNRFFQHMRTFPPPAEAGGSNVRYVESR